MENFSKRRLRKKVVEVNCDFLKKQNLECGTGPPRLIKKTAKTSTCNS